MQKLMQAVRLLLGALLLLSIALNFANVVARYAFNWPFEWAEEVMTIILLWCVFVGAALVTFNNEHLRMNVISDRLPPAWQAALRWLSALCMVGVLGFLLYQSGKVVWFMVNMGQKTAVTEVSSAVPHIAIPIGFALMLLVIIARRGR